MTRQEEIQTADRLWEEYSRHHDRRTRDRLVHQFERLAYSIANRFSRKGVQNEDLYQVALLGLVKAVDRFDPSTRHRFSTFATPTILGEIRRYFRDHSWSLHVPRGLQETAQKVQRATRELTEQLGRTPTAVETARWLEIPVESVQEALRLATVNHVLSLDGEVMTAEGNRAGVLEQSLGRPDPGLESAERRVSVGQAMRRLRTPLREVLDMRYLQDLPQKDVASRMGLSQMQVSRLERRALSELRSMFDLN